jgi:hypothetical protein
MRSRILCVGLLLLISSGALAQSYDMTIHLASGETVTIPHDDIQRIVFALAQTGVGDPTDPQQTPCVFQLLQNHPNPFNPSTIIEYAIPARQEVAIRVFDLKGALVRELLHGVQDAGRHQMAWDGRNDNCAPVSSGVYLCAVSCGGRILSQSLTLVK